MGNIELIIVMEIEAVHVPLLCSGECTGGVFAPMVLVISRAYSLLCCSILMVVIDLVAKLYQFGSELLRKKCVTFALPCRELTRDRVDKWFTRTALLRCLTLASMSIK
jgi:hypothetical protein